MAAENFLPYGRQTIDADDVAAVVETLHSAWLTTGPKVKEFETAVAAVAGNRHAVAVSSGTAALHAAMHVIGIGPGTEVIVPPLSFAATANAVLYQGGRPVFADVAAETLLLDPAAVERQITEHTRAVIAVDYAGQPCDYASLRDLAERHGLLLVADACHSFGGSYRDMPVGTLADLSVFSFHPVKPISCAEGGMVLTDDAGFAERLSCFRNHGIGQDHHQRQQTSSWRYDMQDLGYNYRLSDLHCALGLSQLRKLPDWVAKRRWLAEEYTRRLDDMAEVTPLFQHPDRTSGWHLYVVKVAATEREALFQHLRQTGIGANVHYLPIYLHSYYQRLGYGKGLCPVAEESFKRILSLPLFPGMEGADVERVCSRIKTFYAGRSAS